MKREINFCAVARRITFGNQKSGNRESDLEQSSLFPKLLYSHNRITKNGFTVLEAAIVLLLAGILFAITAPAFAAWWNNYRLTVTQNQVESLIRQAQVTAKQRVISYQVSFMKQGERVHLALHPASASPKSQIWQSLDENIRLVESETTFLQEEGVYRIRFDHYGELSGERKIGGRITFAPVSGGGRKKCVIVSNLLGTTRLGENRPQRNENPCD